MDGWRTSATNRCASAPPLRMIATRNAASRARAGYWSADGSPGSGERFRCQEFLHHRFCVLLLPIHGIVHAAHLFRADAPAEPVESGGNFRMPRQRLPPRDGNRVIRREVVPVV